MSNGQFVTLTVVGIANLAVTAYVAYTAKKAVDKMEAEKDNVKTQANDFIKNLAKNLNDTEF